MLPILQHKPTARKSPLDAGLRTFRLGSDSAKKAAPPCRYAAGQPPLLSLLTSQARRWRHCHVGRFETTLDALGDASDEVAPPLRFDPGGGGALPHDTAGMWASLCRLGTGSVSRLPRPVWDPAGAGRGGGGLRLDAAAPCPGWHGPPSSPLSVTARYRLRVSLLRGNVSLSWVLAFPSIKPQITRRQGQAPLAFW